MCFQTGGFAEVMRSTISFSHFSPAKTNRLRTRLLIFHTDFDFKRQESYSASVCLPKIIDIGSSQG
jgi:hypothetical protein